MTDRAVSLAVKAMGGGGPGDPASAPTPPSSPAAKPPSAQPLPSAESVLRAARHPATRHIVTFVVVLIVLVALNPPFVQEDVERKHAMEAVPCSLPRALVGAFVVTLLVAAIPVLMKHRESFAAAWARVTGWLPKE